MARRNSTEAILPFPQNIDRAAFGHWLSGFTDGEGCFSLCVANVGVGHSRRHPRAKFTISLREDDLEILKLIQSYWRCGFLTWSGRCVPRHAAAKPQWAFGVTRVKDLYGIIVPHFEQHPLLAKKKNDFEVWKIGISMLYKLQGGVWSKHRVKWTASRLVEFQKLIDCLNNVRNPKTQFSPVQTEPDDPLFD